MTLTLFTAPKPFRRPAGMAQWNAIMSWSRLEPRPEILLMGNADHGKRWLIVTADDLELHEDINCGIRVAHTESLVLQGSGIGTI